MISLKSECMHAWSAQGVVHESLDWCLKVTSVWTPYTSHTQSALSTFVARNRLLKEIN